MSINTIKDIKKLPIRYQPIILPNGDIIKKKCSRTILDSRKKLKFLPNLQGKTVLVVGCAEGFFLREARQRGAISVKGIEMCKERVEVASFINKLWGYDIDVEYGDFMSLEGQWDVVICFSVLHHCKENDTDIFNSWEVINNRMEEHLEIIKKVSSLTKETTLFEYPLKNDFEELGKLWVRHGLYKKVEFKGLSQKSRIKNRAIYVGTKT